MDRGAWGKHVNEGRPVLPERRRAFVRPSHVKPGAKE